MRHSQRCSAAVLTIQLSLYVLLMLWIVRRHGEICQGREMQTHLDGKMAKFTILVLHHKLGAAQLVQVYPQRFVRDPVLLDCGGVLVDCIGQLLGSWPTIIAVVPANIVEV